MMDSNDVFARVVELEQEIIQLKDVNREMVEALKLHCDQCKVEQMVTDELCPVIECAFYKVLAKQEVQGE